MTDQAAKIRLKELGEQRRTSGLAEYEWGECASLFSQLGDRRQAVTALAEADKLRLVREAAHQPPEPPAPPVARSSGANALVAQAVCSICHAKLTLTPPQPGGARIVCGVCRAELIVPMRDLAQESAALSGMIMAWGCGLPLAYVVCLPFSFFGTGPTVFGAFLGFGIGAAVGGLMGREIGGHFHR